MNRPSTHTLLVRPTLELNETMLQFSEPRAGLLAGERFTSTDPHTNDPIMTLARNLVLFLLPILAIGKASGQGRPEWKELSAFHTVMSQTFHPAEDGDFKPIRERSGEMVEKAKSWKDSAIPAEYQDVKGIEESLTALVGGSTKLDAKIRSGAKDEEIINELNKLHDVFHTIVGLCRPGH
jgi:hypothetical protein